MCDTIKSEMNTEEILTHSELARLEGDDYDRAHEAWNNNRFKMFVSSTVPPEDTLAYWHHQILEKIRHYTKAELLSLYNTLPYPHPSCLQIAHDCNPVQDWHDV